MKSTVMFLITNSLDIDLRHHIPWDYDEVDAEDYSAVINILDMANTRVRLGDVVQYTWDNVTWVGRDVDILASMLEKLDGDGFKLNVLTEGHIYQQGALVL
jgi:hypothetical protein